MLFNSFDFAVFLPIVFFLYWFVTNKNLTLQNLLIVCSSYVFYGWWDWRFLGLIFFSTLVDYGVGRALHGEEDKRKRKILLWISIAVNLGFLGFFKYYNFFLDNFIDAFSFFGVNIGSSALRLILPVGISFYTFQTLSYTIDVYKKKLTPSKDFIAFSAFVSFFPQLVAGPIERATHLLPQFFNRREFKYDLAVDGMRQILWGLFKKMVIADNCATYANMIFENSGDYSGAALFLGAFFFALQIYGDFSGYSDIAIGTARLFGFDLMQNFNFPYFSRNIAEFWRRWHISLSTWFRDYLYIPLGGSKGSMWQKVRNIFIIFIVSGFWHGANWTFVFWGALNAFYFLPLLLAKRNRNYLDGIEANRVLPSSKVLFQILITFSLTTFAWIFFRANNISHAFEFISDMTTGLFDKSSYTEFIIFVKYKVKVVVLILIMVAIIVEWLGRDGKYAIQNAANQHRAIRWIVYFALVFIIILYSGEDQQFIYFQF